MRVLIFEIYFNKLIVFYFMLLFLILFLKTHVHLREKDTYRCCYEALFWWDQSTLSLTVGCRTSETAVLS
jgi:hypothetical protein